MGHQEHAGARAAVLVDEAYDGLLVGEVEARERFVAQQQARIVGERLPDAQPLLLAAREHPDRLVREAARSDGVDEGVDALAVGASGDRQAEPVPVDAEGDEVAAAHRGVAGQRAGLRQVPDVTVALAAVAAGSHGFAERGDRARAERLEPEDGAEQRRLARAARPEDGDQLARRDGEVEALPQGAVAAAECGTPDLQHRRGRRAPLRRGAGAFGGGVDGHRDSVSASAATFACIQVR